MSLKMLTVAQKTDILRIWIEKGQERCDAMNRHAIKRLEQWKDSKGRKPMIIRGARQVGKTWLMKEFGRTRFAKTAYVNFDNNDRAKAIFEMDFDIERMILALSAETGVEIQAEDTLLIFDEVQEAPKALTSLKYFYENAPQYCIVAAGSLLGVAIHHGTSFPVGKVDFMDLYPLSYTEFLEALGEERFAKLLSAGDTEMMRVFKSKFIERLKEYYFVGRDARGSADLYRKKELSKCAGNSEKSSELLSAGLFKTRADQSDSETESGLEFYSGSACKRKPKIYLRSGQGRRTCQRLRACNSVAA